MKTYAWAKNVLEHLIGKYYSQLPNKRAGFDIRVGWQNCQFQEKQTNGEGGSIQIWLVGN